MSIDSSGLRRLSLQLGRLSGEAPDEARKVIARGALNIKKQMQSEARGAGFPEATRMASDISYETKATRSGIVADIGPTSGDIGSLAFLYYGNSKTGPLLPDPAGALEAEAPNIVEWLAKVGADL